MVRFIKNEECSRPKISEPVSKTARIRFVYEKSV